MSELRRGSLRVEVGASGLGLLWVAPATARQCPRQERTATLLPPIWLIRSAVAAVWLYEGVWCKLLGREPRQLEVVAAVPFLGSRISKLFLWTLGAVEAALAVWVLIGAAPLLCAAVQTVLLVTLNANGLLWARHLIHDPGGMVVKNFAFLVLAWVAAGLSGPT